MTPKAKLLEILLNHESMTKVLLAQLEQEKAELDMDLERIMAAVDAQGISYDRDKVQTSGSPDAMANVIAAADRRRDLYAAVAVKMENEINLIKAVYNELMDMESDYRLVLLALYYPRSTYRAAANLLHVDLSTVVRRRERAVDMLLVRCIKKDLL